MNKFILDCSVYVSWCLNEATSGAASEILQSLAQKAVVVPPLWVYEVTNTLMVAVRMDRLTEEEARQLMSDLPLLPVSFDNPTIGTAASVFQIAHKHNLTAYDAAYIELALRLSLPIASLDEDIIKVSQKLGIDLVSS
ncbi:MAG: type II toxin-antitoxin system VapC family toxin [Candidatus Omnitrophota bacterium]